MRYISAFFTALKLTLQGETLARPYEPLQQWIDRTAELVGSVYETANQHGLNRSSREKIVLKLEGREMSMQTILAGVEYHIKQEYPYLLKHLTPHSITAIYAGNMNDQFYVSRLRDALQDSPVRDRVARLSEHLNAIPPSNELE